MQNNMSGLSIHLYKEIYFKSLWIWEKPNSGKLRLVMKKSTTPLERTQGNLNVLKFLINF